LPFGRHADQRGAVSPAFAASAAFALVWDPSPEMLPLAFGVAGLAAAVAAGMARALGTGRSEEHTSELQSLMRISYAVFCLKKTKKNKNTTYTQSKSHIR